MIPVDGFATLSIIGQFIKPVKTTKHSSGMPMINQNNLILTRTEPEGYGGTQFLYRVKNYGVAAVTRPEEEISQIHWVVDVIKYTHEKTINYEVCHSTELASKTLIFRNDKSLNEFLVRAFAYFSELNILDEMLCK